MEARSQQWTEKMLWRMAIFQFFCIWNQKRESKEDYMKSIGVRLWRLEKARQENHCDWIKIKMERHILLYWWVQDS